MPSFQCDALFRQHKAATAAVWQKPVRPLIGASRESFLTKIWRSQKNMLFLQSRSVVVSSVSLSVGRHEDVRNEIDSVMAEDSDKPKARKVYYSIKEVAAKFGVNESLLRYWETEFPQIKPQTTGNKVRQYTQKNIDQIAIIYNLVKVRGFKLSAARKMLNENRDGVDKTAKMLETLIAVRDELLDIKRMLDRFS